MTICYLTPSDRTDVIPPPLIRPPKKRLDVDGKNVITQAEYLRLPAHEKAGFLLAHEKGIYFRKWEPQGDQHRAAVHRLVEASKSPTHENDEVERVISKQKFLNLQLNGIDKKTGEVLPVDFYRPVPVFEPQKTITPHGQVGCATIVQFREWSDEWRIRTEAMGTVGSAPPSQEGERISELLSERGAKKIAESCEYMALQKGGYETFVTGTFDEEARQKIKLGETTIQREVSRCMDALQKMYQRGWYTSAGDKVPESKGKLAYCWVVEIPLNENGEENPHVHMLLGWAVPFRLFKDWSSRIERIWGNGYFHLEKIKDCACAGAYMAKAAGYLTKAKGCDSQGMVRGNRYGISEPARAPEWVTIGKSQLHTMGQIIADVYDHLTIKYGADYRERKKLKSDLDAAPKNSLARLDIGKRLQAVRAKLAALPIRCNKYQVILKGMSVAGAFITWAKGEKIQRPEWLPELPAELAWQEGRAPTAADSHYFRKLREKFQWLKRCRHAWTDVMLAGWVDQVEQFRACALGAYESWSNSDLCQ